MIIRQRRNWHAADHDFDERRPQYKLHMPHFQHKEYNHKLNHNKNNQISQVNDPVSVDLMTAVRILL